MHPLLLAASIITATFAPGDKKPVRTYLNSVMEPTTKGKAAYYKVVAGQDGSNYVGKIYTMDDVLKAEGRYADADLKVADGHFVYYFPDGKKESEGDYAMGYKCGIWQRYDEWGQQLAEKVYDPEPLADIVYTRAQTMPSYPGGDKELVRYIRSKVAGEDGQRLKAQVTASFIVEKNGELSEVKVVKGDDPALEEKVVDALRSTPAWDPGREKGRPVRVQMQLPVEF